MIAPIVEVTAPPRFKLAEVAVTLTVPERTPPVLLTLKTSATECRVSTPPSETSPRFCVTVPETVPS